MEGWALDISTFYYVMESKSLQAEGWNVCFMFCSGTRTANRRETERQGEQTATKEISSSVP